MTHRLTDAEVLVWSEAFASNLSCGKVVLDAVKEADACVIGRRLLREAAQKQREENDKAKP